MCSRRATVFFALALRAAGLDGMDGPVTCGSAVRLVHVESNFKLHSHPINWGSGSKQQSVTGLAGETDAGGLWLVKDAQEADATCHATAEPVRCGSVVRLEHVATEKNLHSHTVQSALSQQQVRSI